ncbi:AAA family ATPase [Mesorhizobium sp. LNHC209A00]|uniref:ATP-dependent nuclease n=1 Tax=Mesorhizobium sp. LNHC209A00 TaxID=1287226 RepID=UPI000410405A|nr:AAA family ATPase [Mesorhizobium sp. LNHC209A00]
MRIARLEIEGFRSIKSLGIEIPKICALVGPNNAGKSNILEAIRRVLGFEFGPRTSNFTEDDVYLRDPEGDIEIRLTFDKPIEFRKLQKADPVGIDTLSFSWTRYKVTERKGQRRLEQSCLRNGKVPVVQTGWGKAGRGPVFEPVVGIPADVRDQIPFIHIGIDRSLKEQLPSARWSLLRRVFEDIDRGLNASTELLDVPSHDGSHPPVRRVDRFRELMREAMKLLRTKEFDTLEASIKKHALEQLGMDDEDGAIDLYFTPMDTMDFYKSLSLVVKESGFTTNAAEMGGGMQNAIVLAVLRAFEETRRQGAIILIEEPEMFLHPQMQRSLYSAIERLGETNQVIYTTHSPHFVSIPDYRNVALVRKKEAVGTTVVQSHLQATATRLEKLRQSIDSERGELFFAKRVLVVEGDTEKLVIPAFARRIGVDLDAAGGTIVEAGGKRALIDFAELAISFGIPTGIIYDRDSKEITNKEEEGIYNARLDGMASADGQARVWCLDPDYEQAIIAEMGETKSREILDRYPPSIYGKGRARRARMAATDSEMRAPPKLMEAIRWLGAVKPKQPHEPKPMTPEDREWEAAARGEGLG